MKRGTRRTPLILVTFLALHQGLPAAAQEAVELDDMRDIALELTNRSRDEAGLSPLTRADLLDEAAQDHAEDMLERDYYDHVTPEGETPFDRFLDAGGNSWAVSGENIATCRGCPVPPQVGRVDAFHDGWMQSPGHRENILSEGFDSFGFGIAGAGETVYAVQTFSGPGADVGDAGAALSATEVTDAAVQKINAARAAADLDPLEHDADLDQVANRVLESLAQDADALPQNVFDLLPDGSSGWTSLALQTATTGGSGVSIEEQDLSPLIRDWTEADPALGGSDATHVGFAAEAGGDGRLSAVAVFAGT